MPSHNDRWETPGPGPLPTYKRTWRGTPASSQGAGRHMGLPHIPTHNPHLHRPAGASSPWLSQRQQAEEKVWWCKEEGRWSHEEMQKKNGKKKVGARNGRKFLPQGHFTEQIMWYFGGFAEFSFTASLLTPCSCLMIFFVLVNMHAIYFCQTINPNLFIV